MVSLVFAFAPSFTTGEVFSPTDARDVSDAETRIKLLGISRSQFPWVTEDLDVSNPIWGPETMNWVAVTIFPVGRADLRIHLNNQGARGWVSATYYQNGKLKKIGAAKTEWIPDKGKGSLDEGMPKGTLNSWLALSELRAVNPSPALAEILELDGGYAFYLTMPLDPSSTFGYIQESGQEWVSEQDKKQRSFVDGGTLYGEEKIPYPISSMERQEVRKMIGRGE